MRSLNPVSIFYFTTCLRLNDSEAKLYYCILESLTRSGNSEKEILSSIRNITLCDVPFQIYSFPFVLDSLARLDKLNPSVNAILKQYFELFVPLFRDQKVASEIFYHITEGSNAGRHAEKIIALCEFSSIESANPGVAGNNFTYIDIVQFACEAIMLSLMDFFCETQAHTNFFANFIAANPGSGLASLIENSCTHRKGRLCFLLGIELKKYLLQLKSREEFISMIWNNDRVSASPDLEPDLIFLFLSYWFIQFDTTTTEAECANNISSELAHFSLYERCLIRFNYKTHRDEFIHSDFQKYLRLLFGQQQLVSGNYYEKKSISINIWIGSLCLLASDHFSVPMANSILLKIWWPLNYKDNGLLVSSSSSILSNIISSCVNSKSGGEQAEKANTKNNFRILSPWLAVDGSEKTTIYIGVDSFGNWLRILYAVAASKTMLLKSSAVKNRPFAFFLVFVADLLSYCRQIIKGDKVDDYKNRTGKRIEQVIQQKPNFNKIILMLNRDINILIGGDNLAGIDRKYFFSLLKPPPVSHDQIPSFHPENIPRVLFNWIYHGIQSSVAETEKIQKGNFEALENKLQPRQMAKIQVLRKYLHHDHINNIAKSDNQQDNVLLLSPTRISDIPEYDKNDWLIKSGRPVDDNKRKQYSFAVAIQRFRFALATNHELSNKLGNDLIEVLREIRLPQDLGNLHRFALISIFDDFDKATEANCELFKLVIEVLFELNGFLDVTLVCDKIIEIFAYAEQIRFNNAQIDILNCLSNCCSVALRYNINEKANNETPSDPLQNIQQDKRIDFFRQTLASIQFIICKHRQHIGNRVKVVNYTTANFSSYSITNSDVSVTDDVPTFTLPFQLAGNPAGEIALITYNRIEQASQAYSRNILLPPGIINLFTLSEPEKKKFFETAGDEFVVLAQCLGSIRDGKKEIMIFKVDHDKIEYLSLPVYECKTGTLVQLKYVYDKNSRIPKRYIDGTYCKPIKPEMRPVSLLSITRVEDVARHNLPLKYWLPCHSDILTGYIRAKLGTVGMKIRPEDNNKPAAGFLNTLLLRIEDINSIISLTFIDKEWDHHRQEYGYLFYRSFGTYLMLFEDEITFETASDYTLLEYIQASVDNNNIDVANFMGLIVSFQVIFSGGRVMLALASGKADEKQEDPDRFPQLEVPLDYRNIRWMAMFDDSSEREFIAKRINQRWICQLPDSWAALNFEPIIEVSLDWEPKYLNEVEFSVIEGWKSDEGRFDFKISGKVIERIKINVPQLKRYLSLVTGDPVSVKKHDRLANKAASVICYTRDNCKAYIDVEELTFIPAGQRKNFDNAFSKGEFFISNILPWKTVFTELIIQGFPEGWSIDGQDTITGYFVDVPRNKEKGVNKCSIVIEYPDGSMSAEILVSIENIDEINIQRVLSVYAKIEGHFDEGRWHFFLLTRQIFLKALWQLRETNGDNLPADCYFIGKGNLNGQSYYLFQRHESFNTLIYTREIAQNLLKNDLFAGPDHINSNWLSRVLVKNYPRLGFENNGLLIAGGIHNSFSVQNNQSAYLKNISYRFEQTGKDSYFIRRYFLAGIVYSRSPDKEKQPVQAVEKQNAKRLTDFNDYFTQPYELTGILNKENLTVRISYSSGLKWVPGKTQQWTNEVPFEKNSITHLEDLVFVPSAIPKYNYREVSFWLSRNASGDVYATFKYGYDTVDNLLMRYNAEFGDPINISDSMMYFFDKEKIHPFLLSQHEEEMYRFEEGFGKNILIPRSRILWNGNPIQTGDLSLFPNDAVKIFNFVEVTENENKSIKLNILSTEISEGKRLYRQAKDHNIFHLAHIGCNSGGVYIKYVTGADENSIRDSSMTTIYDRINASFDILSRNHLKARFTDYSQEKVVVVKVDTLLFEKTGKLRFRHHKLTFIESSGKGAPNPLEDKARIIMLLDKIDITGFGNDYSIRVKPYPYLDNVDIGQDFRNGRILRRDFSLNEGILREYFRRGNLSYFEGFEVYVTVQKNNMQNPVAYSLLKNPLFRTQDILNAYRGQGIIGIAKYSSDEADSLIIEIKPGNFLSLESQSLEFEDLSRVKKGDVLQILVKSGPAFLVNNAIAGDYRFLENGRRVVVLPKDSLFKSPSNIYRKNSKEFTIGGLPNIEMDFEDSDRNAVGIFLICHHPKIASVVNYTSMAQEVFLLQLRSNNDISIYGYISIDEKNGFLTFVSSEPGIKRFSAIKWHNASFYDGSVTEIIERIKNCNWRYHDEQSFNFEEVENAFVTSENYKLLPSSLIEKERENFITGPLFIKKGVDEINLRFDDNLAQWGYPVSSLIDFLDYRNGSYTFAYSGKSHDMHFVEIAPGRIVELPVNLLVLKIDGIEIPIRDYAWDFLQAGDEITLKNIADDLGDLFKIQVLAIRHNPRNVLSGNAKLPIQKIDSGNGAIELGSVNFIIKQPISQKNLNWDIDKPVEFLKASNEMLLQSSRVFLKAGDTVLLSVKGRNYLYFPSLEKMRPVCPDDMDIEYVCNLIRACGGAIPVYLVKNDQTNLLEFSLASLKKYRKKLEGKVINGIISGTQNNFEEIVIQIGGFFEPVPFNSIISGVHISQRKFVSKALINMQTWLHVSFDNLTDSLKFDSGIAADSIDKELFVVKQLHVTDQHGRLLGTICRAAQSQKMYWMPESEMAWCDVDISIADFVFLNPAKQLSENCTSPLKVRICETNDGYIVSRTKVADLYNSFFKKRCGSDNMDTLVVSIPASEASEKIKFIGFSLIHKVLINCVLYTPTILPQAGQIIKTEVIEKDNPGFKINTLYGVKKLVVYLPIYSKTLSIAHEKNEADSFNKPIDAFMLLDNNNLRKNVAQIINICKAILSLKDARKVSLKSAFILLERLCVLQNIDRYNNYIAEIKGLIRLLKINLLRHVCIEILNKNAPYKAEEQYLDLVLMEVLKPFCNLPEVIMEENDLLRLKKLAMKLCFQSQSKRFIAIGNAILQALGLSSNLDTEAVNESILFYGYTILSVYSLNESGVIEDYFLGSLNEMIKMIEVNQIEINLLSERFQAAEL